MASKPDDIDPDSVARKTRAAVDKLSRETERLKKLSELQSLLEGPREVSIDVEGLLSMESDQEKPPPDSERTSPKK